MLGYENAKGLHLCRFTLARRSVAVTSRFHASLAFLGLALFIVSLCVGVSAADSSVKLAQPVNWGSPDQPYGKRRPVTAADRAAIQR
jgi:hypothetical protein